MSRVVKYVTLCLVLLLFAGTAHAFHADSFRNKDVALNSTIPASLSVQVGVVNGEARELVYEEGKGRKVSELQWDIDNVVMAGVKGSFDFTDWLSFNGGFWMNLTGGDDGYMDDYDWLTSDPRWSDWSHSRITVEKAISVDTNFEIKIFEWDYLALSGLVGFKFDNWKWEDSGGSYVYSISGWRNSIGNFPENETGIGYEQWFYCPYVGIQTDSDFGDFKLKTYVKGTIYAWADDEDYHYSRRLVFNDSFSNIKYLGAGISGCYSFTQNIFSTISVDYQKYYRQVGNVKERSTVTGETSSMSNGAGIDNETLSIGLELGFNF
ncbi:omptin family outer membrane protease [Maridesulfovibrio sp. FT414]|uniref:omptin family outer membrane protease n=1 Tax=Maridesulfovibrio sp. FT414 TaxID=2979469 RepID=UPI003D804F34